MTDLIPSEARPPVETAALLWLSAKAARSQSSKTERAYRDTLGHFRAALQSIGLDLDSDIRLVATAADAWASRDTPAPATYNQRLAVISSFYTFARKRGLLTVENPIGLVERRPTQAYAHAESIAPVDVRRKLAAIDRSDLASQRDYALLAVALQTGRRVAEIAALRWSHIRIEGERVRLHFVRAKGGKVMADVLPASVARALTSYLAALYGPQIGDLPPTAPIWAALSRNRPGREALSARSLETIARQRLGVHFHALRHTFARTMEDAGAKVSDIQARLGHASLATTGRYLAALRAAENPHGERVADLLGLGA
jgi:integrase